MKKSRVIKRLILLVSDIAVVAVSAFVAMWLRYLDVAEIDVGTYIDMLFYRLPYLILFSVAAYFLASFYSTIWSFSGIYDFVKMATAVTMANLVALVVDLIVFGAAIDWSVSRLPISVYMLAWFINMLLIAISRVLIVIKNRYSRDRLKNFSTAKRLMIVGAGQMGTIMINELEHNDFRYGKPIVAVDDSSSKFHGRIKGVPIAGKTTDIPEVARKYEIDEIIICMPSATIEKQRKVIEIAMKTGCELKISPSVHEMAQNSFKMSSLKNVEVTDLLSRPEVKLDKEICQYLLGQVVLITGGGGSIGSELCRQVALYDPKSIVIFDVYENNAYDLMNELKARYPEVDVQVRVGSVRELDTLETVFEEFKPSVVFHAAAHKHVPLMEDTPCQAVRNNVFGTYNTALCADKYGVKKFVLLSTDKAVNPTNVMGATKRITELIIQYMSTKSKTCFAAVRFGNVLGSNGSVIPLFKRQIKNGGPVTVTHPDITRYFMTIPEAAQLVVQAGGVANGGEIFVLDMGEPVKIYDLAKNLIKLSGYEPDVDIKIEFTGLRPGEKMYEELSMDEENEGRIKTKNNKIFITKPFNMDYDEFYQKMLRLKTCDNSNVRELIKDIVPNYTSQSLSASAPCENAEPETATV
ncbi:MAG: polysaccharide biosynthesis protein [Clostridia bacterium]|nr:polysaccharide biosynthesis protein [Clostridia bacterium]